MKSCIRHPEETLERRKTKQLKAADPTVDAEEEDTVIATVAVGETEIL